jgi:tetratricopeptide (TPR) repeat protein
MADDKDALLGAWKTFLKGRIAEEKGEKDEALRAYDEALAIDPGNGAFQRARANVRSALGEPDDAVAVRIAHQYEHLAAQLTGPDDDPESWVNSLEHLLQVAERGDALESAGQARMVIW